MKDWIWTKRNKMEKQFIPYNLALELKNLGFDEECLGYYDGNHNFQYMFNGRPDKFSNRRMGVSDSIWVGWISAPLYQQVFDWFREKYGLLGFITNSNILGDITYHLHINSINNYTIGVNCVREINIFDIKDYYQARQICLERLIELCEKKK